MRKIIHIDMDAFFAAIEQRDRPELRGKPVIVGGSPDRRGVVSTCSYETRVFGVHSAMPTRTAYRLCPQAIFLPVDMKKYRKESEKIREIFFRYTDIVEPVSIDEAYLDVTENKVGIEHASKIARMIQREIYETTGLTASAGVSYNKFLAKIASDMKKPAGMTVIPPAKAQELLDQLPIPKFHGLGKVSAGRLASMNIRTGRDLRQLDLTALTALFGKTGAYYYEIVRGVDNRPIEVDWERKSIGHETTFAEDCTDARRLRILLRAMGRRVANRLRSRNLAGKTVTVKIRYEDFKTITRSHSFPTPTADGAQIGEMAVELAVKEELGKRPVRLIGVTVSNFADPRPEEDYIQLEFEF